MKAIVIYYSLEGNTKYVADKIADNIRADLLRLEPVKEYPKGNASKYIWGGKSVVFGEKPKLQPYQLRSEDYDVIIIGTPIWAGSYTPPIHTFLSENHLSGKKIALYACNSGGDADKCFSKIKKELADSDVIATLTLAEPYTKQSENNDKLIKEFCNKL